MQFKRSSQGVCWVSRRHATSEVACERDKHDECDGEGKATADKHCMGGGGETQSPKP